MHFDTGIRAITGVRAEGDLASEDATDDPREASLAAPVQITVGFIYPYLIRERQRRSVMGAAENMAWLRRVYEWLDAGDPGVIEEAWDLNFQGHWPGQELHGRQGYSDMISAFRAGLPDFKHEIEIMMAANDMVAAHAVITGTHRGELFGKAPTGKRVEFTSTAIWRIHSRKIAEIWCDFDLAGVMTQLDIRSH